MGLVLGGGGGAGGGGPETDPVYSAQGATAAQLSTAITNFNTAVALKQNASDAATDAEVAALQADIEAAISDIEAAVALLPDDSEVAAAISAAVSAHAAGDASDEELADALADLAAETSARTAADSALDERVDALETRLVTVPPLPLIDIVGHSLAGGSIVTSQLGPQASAGWNLARLLGANRVRDLAVGGSKACWPGLTSPGEGGWGWVIGAEISHGVEAAQKGTVPPFLPNRHAAIIWATQNDLAELGSNKPVPMQEALRSLISWACSGAFIDHDHAAWAYSGAGWSTAGTNGFGSGASAGWHQTATTTNKATLTLPAGTAAEDVGFPGAPYVACIDLLLDPTHDLTIGIKIDGVAQADRRLTGSSLCDTEVAGKFNTICLRFTGLAAGTHTIELELKTQHVAGSTLYVNDGRIEADPADGPVVIVPSSIKAQDSDYSLWNGTPHGPDAGTNPLNDAAVDAWKVAEEAVVDEFGDNVQYFDVDSAIAQNDDYFYGDFIHLNERGSRVAVEYIYNELIERGTVTLRRAAAPAVVAGDAFTRVSGTVAGMAYTNSWVSVGASVGPPLAFFIGLDGRVHLRGAVVSGSAAAAAIATLPVGARPRYPLELVGLSSTGTIQRWQITTAGVISVVTGGATATRNVLPPVSFAPAAV